MKIFSGIISIFVFCVLMQSMPLNAEAQEKLESGATEIITDQENSTVTIVIDGQPVAIFDKDGLHIVGDISYEGAITDVGQGRVRELIKKPGERK